MHLGQNKPLPQAKQEGEANDGDAENGRCDQYLDDRESGLVGPLTLQSRSVAPVFQSVGQRQY